MGSDKTKYGYLLYTYNHQNICDAYYFLTTTTNVGGYKTNPWGLHDLLGNVWEWCQDDWVDGYHGHPSDGSAMNTESNVKVVRGGCFESSQNDCCSFSRSSRDINIADKTLGFRVVCVP
jgi:formylglycine-generating enzyme required for sulfatase activity